jgi:hypothetical protein
MKSKTKIQKVRVALFTLLIAMLSIAGYAQSCPGNQVTVTLQAFTEDATHTQVEFDVWISNTGSTVLRLGALQGSVIINTGFLPAGATGTFTMVTSPAATGNFPAFNNPGPSFVLASRQLKWTNTAVTLVSGNTVALPANTPMKFARFRFTSSLPFTSNFAGTLTPSFTVAGGITNVLATVYCSGNPNSTGLGSATAGTLLIPGSPYPITLNGGNICFTSGTYIQTPVTCFGGNNGTATITMNPTPTNLAATYVLDSGASTPVTLSAGSTFTLTGLTAGAHTLSVTGSGSCTTPVDVPFTIGGPAGPLTNTTTITACDSYTWSVTGLTYTTSGPQTGTTVNGGGCTVNETLNLTINNSTSNTTTVTACDTYTWAAPLGNGQTYTTNQTGITNVSTNAANCPHTETLNLTINPSPVTAPYSVCQGGTVSGGLVSNLGGGGTAVPNYSGDTTGAPTYNRALDMDQGGVCGNSVTGAAVHYTTHSFIAPASGAYVFSLCGTATWDTFLSLYQNPFVPAGLCAGNTLIEASDDDCGGALLQSEVTATLVQGTAYTLVVAGFDGTEFGPYTVTSTSPVAPPSVEWYTTPTLGSAIGTGSPFNPVGVAGSGIADTNTVGLTTFYAQFPGSTCRTPAVFTVSPTTPTTTTVTACDTYTWSVNGTTYTTGGIYTSVTGCTTETLNLTINTTVNIATTISACDSYTWPVNGTTYTTGGVFTVPYTLQSGIFNTLATWNSTATANGATVATNPLSGLALSGGAVNVTINGVAVNMTSTLGGMYVAPTFVGANNANQPVTMTFTPPAYGVGGNYYLTDATDAIITGNLTVTYSDGTIDTAPVTNDTDFFGFFKNTGITSIVIVPVATNPIVNRFVSLKNLRVAVAPPCQTRTLNLTITPSTTNGNVTTSICAGGSYTWPLPNGTGLSYTTAQTNLTNTVGCNTATLNLTITPLTTNGSVTTSICAGGSYTWPLPNGTGLSYTTAQTNLTNTVGCNTATLNLTITPLTTNGSVTTSICAGGSYTWPLPNGTGLSYTTAQTNLTNTVGCNTATLNLTITPLTTNGSVTTSICAGGSYTWPLPNGTGLSYTTAQTNLTNTVGCNTATLNLTINTAPTPTGSASQSFSVVNLNNATIASLVVSPAGVIWYATLLDAQNGTNPLASTTVITNGSTYWAVNVVGGCRSTPFAVAVTVTLGNEEFDNLNFSF